MANQPEAGLDHPYMGDHLKRSRQFSYWALTLGLGFCLGLCVAASGRPVRLTVITPAWTGVAEIDSPTPKQSPVFIPTEKVLPNKEMLIAAK